MTREKVKELLSVIFVCDWCGVTPYPITFPTKEMVEEFKECFSDLIKKAFLPE